jgi:hypothetical protein
MSPIEHLRNARPAGLAAEAGITAGVLTSGLGLLESSLAAVAITGGAGALIGIVIALAAKAAAEIAKDDAPSVEPQGETPRSSVT